MRFNLKRTAKQYGMRQARIQARRNGNTSSNSQSQKVYYSDDTLDEGWKIMMILGFIVFVLIFIAIIS